MGICQTNNLAQEVNKTIRKILGLFFIINRQIKCLFWAKNQHSLFDYEAKPCIQKTICAYNHGSPLSPDYIIKQRGDFLVRNFNNYLNTSSDMKYLYQAQKKGQSYLISPVKNHQDILVEKNIWLVVKSLPAKKYPLRDNDIIKMGRLKIKVRELVTVQDEDSQREQILTVLIVQQKQIVYEEIKKKDPKNQKQQKQTQETQQLPLCRICLDPGQIINPLVKPCKCQGSMKFIHLKCLKSWLNKKLNPFYSNYFLSLNWKPLQCELCRSNFPYKIYLDDNKYYTVDVPKPAKPYIALEILSQQLYKTFYLITLADKKKLLMGRKHDIDIKLSDDISVSRRHASLTYNQLRHQFYIEDAQSKFGTLILIRNPLKLNPSRRNVCIQCGSNVFMHDFIFGEMLNQVEQNDGIFVEQNQLQTSEQQLQLEQSKGRQLCDNNNFQSNIYVQDVRVRNHQHQMVEQQQQQQKGGGEQQELIANKHQGQQKQEQGLCKQECKHDMMRQQDKCDIQQNKDGRQQNKDNRQQCKGDMEGMEGGVDLQEQKLK